MRTSSGINRIRLEFKGLNSCSSSYSTSSINRIRLEFKEKIEGLSEKSLYRINRIRLEFKGGGSVGRQIDVLWY